MGWQSDMDAVYSMPNSRRKNLHVEESWVKSYGDSL